MSKPKVNIKVAIICPYPQGYAPSQRFRFEQYIHELSVQGIHFDFHPFISSQVYSKLYGRGKIITKIWATLIGYFKRFRLAFSLNEYDTVFIHREITPFGPPLFEWLYPKVNPNIIYDFDDAIWLDDRDSSFINFFKFKNRVG